MTTNSSSASTIGITRLGTTRPAIASGSRSIAVTASASLASCRGGCSLGVTATALSRSGAAKSGPIRANGIAIDGPGVSIVRGKRAGRISGPGTCMANGDITRTVGGSNFGLATSTSRNAIANGGRVLVRPNSAIAVSTNGGVSLARTGNGVSVTAGSGLGLKSTSDGSSGRRSIPNAGNSVAIGNGGNSSITVGNRSNSVNLANPGKASNADASVRVSAVVSSPALRSDGGAEAADNRKRRRAAAARTPHVRCGGNGAACRITAVSSNRGCTNSMRTGSTGTGTFDHGLGRRAGVINKIGGLSSLSAKGGINIISGNASALAVHLTGRLASLADIAAIAGSTGKGGADRAIRGNGNVAVAPSPLNTKGATMSLASGNLDGNNGRVARISDNLGSTANGAMSLTTTEKSILGGTIGMKSLRGMRGITSTRATIAIGNDMRTPTITTSKGLKGCASGRGNGLLLTRGGSAAANGVACSLGLGSGIVLNGSASSNGSNRRNAVNLANGSNLPNASNGRKCDAAVVEARGKRTKGSNGANGRGLNNASVGHVICASGSNDGPRAMTALDSNLGFTNSSVSGAISGGLGSALRVHNSNDCSGAARGAGRSNGVRISTSASAKAVGITLGGSVGLGRSNSLAINNGARSNSGAISSPVIVGRFSSGALSVANISGSNGPVSTGGGTTTNSCIANLSGGS